MGDHHSLHDLDQLFCAIDSNGDGVLCASEVKNFFQDLFVNDCEVTKDLDQMFVSLDLDGSGTIAYTEFCAACLGERAIEDENALRAAFKTFDVYDSGCITEDAIVQVFCNTDVDEVWSDELCHMTASDVITQFDHDCNGWLDFDEWSMIVRE